MPLKKSKKKSSVKVEKSKRDNGGVARVFKKGELVKTVTWTSKASEPSDKELKELVK